MSDSPILLDIPRVLVGDRIAVSAWKPGDGQALFDAVQESLDHILPWMPWGPAHDSPRTSELCVRKWSAGFDLREDVPLAIWNRDQTHLIGGTGIHRMDWHVGSFEIGYWVRASDHGKGYVTDAVKLVTTLLFEQLSANRVFIRCAVKNMRSGAIPRRLGFVHEGVIRNSAKDALGDLHDMDMYSLIPEDYEKLPWKV